MTGPGTRGDAIIVAVADAVAEAEGCDPIELEPLFETVDPDALTALFDGTADVHLSFEYHGYEVVVSGPDSVDVSDGR